MRLKEGEIWHDEWTESNGVTLVILADDIEELLKVNALIGVGLVVDMQRVQHLQNFLVVDVVAGQTRQLFEFIVVDEVVSVFVDQLEHSFQAFLGLNVSDVGSH